MSLDPHPSPADIRAMCARKGIALPSGVAQEAAKGAKATPKPFGPYRSKWEQQYAAYLELRRTAHLIRSWSYEPDRLQIGTGAFYTPDFRIYGEWLDNNGRREYHEVKGYRREAAIVRIKVAALKYPEFRFILVTKRGGQWHHEPISR